MLEIEAKDFDNACCQALHNMDEWVIADMPIDEGYEQKRDNGES